MTRQLSGWIILRGLRSIIEWIDDYLATRRIKRLTKEDEERRARGEKVEDDWE